jgi:hypothetical protein
MTNEAVAAMKCCIRISSANFVHQIWNCGL